PSAEFRTHSKSKTTHFFNAEVLSAFSDMRKSALIFAILFVHFLALWGMAVNRRVMQDDPHRLAQTTQPAFSEAPAAQSRPTPATATSPASVTDSTYEEYMRNRREPEAHAQMPAPATANFTQPSPFSLQFNLDYTTAYFYHGIMQEDSGLILQPAA